MAPDRSGASRNSDNCLLIHRSAPVVKTLHRRKPSRFGSLPAAGRIDDVECPDMGRYGTNRCLPLLAVLAALAGPAMPGLAQQEETTERADGVAGATPQAPKTAPAARPEACLDGRELGPIRVQLGTVEALTRVGEEVAIPVRVKGVCGLAGFAFGITLETRVAQLVRVEQTPFLSGKPPVAVEFLGLQPGAPRQTIAGLRARGSGGVDGIGTLANVYGGGAAA